MCKLYVATGPLSADQIKYALMAANSAFRSTEKDGFGFLAANGLNIARGRYLEPATFTGYMKNLPAWLTGPMAEENQMPKSINTLVIHGRTSTNRPGLDNVHPFCYQSYYLAHNGIVSWKGDKKDEPKQACDSDQFLHWLIDNRLDWKAAYNSWAGWGAMALYNRKNSELTIARDGATLSIARRKNNRGWIFATTEKHLLWISKHAGIILDTPPLNFPRHIINIVNGQIVSEQSWAGFGVRQWTPLDNVASGKLVRVKMATEFFPDYVPSPYDK